MEIFAAALSIIEESLWSYIGLPIILILGVLLTIRFKMPQISRAYEIFSSLTDEETATEKVPIGGVTSLQAFFTTIGGCIGIGNIVGVCVAIQIGGPGALLWMWVAAFLGMMIKYSEVYLGLKFRVRAADGSYAGGPMFFLRKAFKSPFFAVLVTVLLALYGVEIYMFRVVTESIVSNWSLPSFYVVCGLLFLVLFAGSGGIARVGKICSWMIPLFIVLYVGMCAYILAIYSSNIVPAFKLILISAFNPKAALGGAAASLLLTMFQGVARGCYSGDVGIGYASMIFAEVSSNNFKRQGRLAILGIFIDTFVICTATTLIIVVSEAWRVPMAASQLVQFALAAHIPYMHIFMPIFIFLLGYSTMIAFFCVGLKCASYLSADYGKKIYYAYAALIFLIFSYVEQSTAMSVMSIAGALLLIVNVYGIYKLRDEIEI